MKNSLFLLLHMVLLLPFAGSTQIITLRGIVRSALTREPIGGATIALQGNSHATATDSLGEFTMPNVPSKGTLLISSVGYESLERKISSAAYLSILLTQRINALDETVVLAYGTTTKRFNTGSVYKVPAAILERQPVSDPIAALEGRVPGLFITQNTGLPGSNFSVLIRGQNSIQQGNDPLYVIDGVPFPASSLAQNGGSLNVNSPFNSLNPADIESIEVLKDADATAIYGSRGANGVILITTKKGKAGAATVEINSYNGWGRTTRTMNFLSTPQYLSMRHEAFANDGVTPSLGNAPDLVAWDTTRYTDWKKLLIGSTAHTTNTQLRFSGGNDQTRFSLSAGYYSETTVFPGSASEHRSTASVSLNHNSLNNKWSVNFSASYAADHSSLLNTDLTQFINLPPDAPPPFDSSGKLRWSENGGSYTNPLSTLLQTYVGITNRLTGNLILSYELVHGLHLKATAGYNTLQFSETTLLPVAAQDPSFSPTGSATFGTNAVQNWAVEPQAEYNAALGSKGKLEALIGTSWQENKNNSSLITGTGYTDDLLLQSIANAPSLFSSNNNSLYHYEALFGRLLYNWANKYLLHLTGRRDGSSRFGPGRQFANFGAVGAAWIFSEEPLIKRLLPFLSYGKLRGSYGTTGNDQIGNYQYLDTWSNTYLRYQGQPALRPQSLFNEDYGWELNRKWEAALELGTWHDRLLLTFDWFLNRSSNQLIYYTMPTQTGFSSIVRNFPGIVQNKGFEIEMTCVNLKNQHWNWTTTFTLTVPRNQLKAFPGLASSSYATSYVIGQPLNLFLGYRYLGVNTQTGIYQFKDVNGDGVLDMNDYAVLGTTNPKFYGGLDNTLSYRQWSLSVFVHFVKQTGLHPVFYSSGRVGDMINEPVAVLAHWQHPGDSGPYQQYSQSFGNDPAVAASNITISSASLSEASYIRVKNVSLGYNLSGSGLKKIKLDHARLYIEGQNLFTLTHYAGADPENQSLYSLPPLKVLALGLQLTF